MFVSIPVTTSSRLWAPSLAHVLGWITLPWMAFAGLTVFYLLVVDLAQPSLRGCTRTGRAARPRTIRLGT